MKKSIASLLCASFIMLMLSVNFVSASVQGDIQNQLQPVGDVYGQSGTTDGQLLARAVADVIKIVLGFLGVIFVVLIVYAGFMWMTSGGNEDKIKSAKQTMIAAIIGAAIVLGAYAITTFVIDGLLKATGVSEGGL